MNQQDFGRFLANVPGIVNQVVYDYMGRNNNKIPRFSSVFKLVKEELRYEGVDYKKLSKEYQEELEYMARDVYDGMREAGF